MAKRITVLIIFIAILALTFLGNAQIYRCVDRLNSLLDDAVASAGKDDVVEKTQALLDEWEVSSETFEALIEHAESDNIGMSIEKLMAYAEQKEASLFLGEAGTLRFLFDHIKEKNILSIQNVF